MIPERAEELRPWIYIGSMLRVRFRTPFEVLTVFALPKASISRDRACAGLESDRAVAAARIVDYRGINTCVFILEVERDDVGVTARAIEPSHCVRVVQELIRLTDHRYIDLRRDFVRAVGISRGYVIEEPIT